MEANEKRRGILDWFTKSENTVVLKISVFALVIALFIDFLAYIISNHSDLFKALLG